MIIQTSKIDEIKLKANDLLFSQNNKKLEGKDNQVYKQAYIDGVLDMFNEVLKIESKQ